MLIDTHTHLFLDNYEADIDCVVRDALQRGIEKMLLPHIDSHSTQRMLELSYRYPGVCIPMMGLHPGSVRENFRDELEMTGHYLQENKFIALGEIGMDLYWDKTFRREQEEVFRKHLDWSVEFKLPLVIHSRNAVDELLKIISEFPPRTYSGVFHSFTGSLEQAKKAIELGFFIGITGIITFRNSGLERMAESIGLDNILIETDSPYLAPVPYRGKRNESAYLPYIAQRLANIYETSFEEVALTTAANANKVFNLSKFQ